MNIIGKINPNEPLIRLKPQEQEPQGGGDSPRGSQESLLNSSRKST